MCLPDKSKVFEFCESFIAQRIRGIQSQIKEVSQALASENKSTAGDKHETGRAMLQLEREKLGQQLFEAEKMVELFRRVDRDTNSQTAVLGSLVITNLANYYLAISAGKYTTPETEVYCISTFTPIGKLVLGKSSGDTFTFNNKTHKILHVL
ncbi:MAG: 3-oxoacyl-ACP synthase [Croceitalea sp.]|nr:3-oxoacyl-ACP synthase [Croceitalea sp.]NNM18352.1 3-oxoacyl-ACP synthase [Croceitalea sp.]